jgi:outer membrane protein OmpA-like peptidoglycan-associated protein
MSDRGIKVARVSTDGLGAENPVVPNSDYQDRWKNRRVEFYIAK